MTSIDVDVAVIGGGPAGLAAAREAARSGMAVALIEAEAAGGRAARATTLPMRMLSLAADAEREDWPNIRREIAERVTAWTERSQLTLEDAGVELVRGRACFASPRELAVEGGPRVTFDRAIITAGAEAAMLPGATPDGARLIAPDGLSALAALPETAMVIGGGAAGAEIADVLSRLGVRVTWVMDELGILPRFDRELADSFGDVLMDRGVKLVHGKRVLELALGDGGATAKLDGGRTYTAKLAVVAVGSRPSADGLGLAEAGLRTDARGALMVDEHGRTNVAHLFAAGDVTGKTVGVAGAEAMGRVAGRAAAEIEGPAFRPERAPQTVLARPELAQVGLTPDVAAGRPILIHTLRLKETLAGALHGAGAKGLLRLVCMSEDGTIAGATALGPGAADAVSAAALAIELGVTDEQLASSAAAVPGALDALVRAVR